MDLRIVEGDLLDQDVEVIVNAWNRNLIPWWLLLPQGVSKAIKRRGGRQPFREVSRKRTDSTRGSSRNIGGKTSFQIDHSRRWDQFALDVVGVVGAKIGP